MKAAEKNATRASANGNRANGESPDSGVLAIETRELVKSFGPNKVLAGCSLQIPEGSSSTILGPSGTGKSVLIKHILGLMKPDSGEVRVHDRPLSKMSRSEILGLRRDVGVLFQDGALFSSMSVYDNVAFPLRQHTDLKDNEIREVVMEHIKAVGLEAAVQKSPNQLSGGMRKRAGLARALVLDPTVLLCDEPDSGLDPVRTSLLADLLLQRHEEVGGTMIVVTHNMELTRYVSDHISLLWRGEVVESGPVEKVFGSEDPFVQQFVAGEVAGPLAMD
jgi:ABC-type transporter Mla maintaining outer membrane lipid asymmetry ATPase subunit MlaF